MPASVSFHCPCLGPDSVRPQASPFGSSAHAAQHGQAPWQQQGHDQASSSSISAPLLSNRSSFHQLSSLYFCEECDSIRCSLCVTVEPSSYFCPNCLFDVPLPSVKESRTRCDRSCFECPICQNALNLVGADNEKGIDPLHASASVGVPPYYLLCNICKWDSKESGIVFEKPTGLAVQMKRSEESAPDLVEFNSLKAHFKDYMDHQISSIESHSSPNAAPASIKSSAAMAAATAALRQSRLLRDVPSLARDTRFLKGLNQSSSKEKDLELFLREENKTYKSNNSYKAERGVVFGKREERRLKLSERLSDATNFTTFEQRWQNPWDQNIRISDLRPSRVRLHAKQTKRCPSCKHIIIKPDVKAPIKRFKIRLMAMNYLPDIFILGPVSAAPLLGGNVGLSIDEIRAAKRASLLGGAGSVGGRSSESGTGSSLRRRPQSVMIGGGSTGLGSSAFIGGTAGTAMDEEHLTPGRIYTFEMTFTNPLDDAMQVNLGVVMPSSASTPTERAGSLSPTQRAAQGSTSPPPPSSPPGPQSSPRKSAPASSTQDPMSPHRAAPPSRQLWSVTPSTTSFPINAFNEVWELDEEDSDLLKEPKPSLLGDDVEDDPDKDDHNGDDGNRHRGSRKTRKNDGILKRKGNATTIGLDLSLAKEAAGEIELLLYVAYTYRPDEALEEEEEEGSKSKKGHVGKTERTDATHSTAKTFSFWCRVRLGCCDGASTAAPSANSDSPVGAPAGLAGLERRKSALAADSTSASSAFQSIAGSALKAESRDVGRDTLATGLVSPPTLERKRSTLVSTQEDAEEQIAE